VVKAGAKADTVEHRAIRAGHTTVGRCSLHELDQVAGRVVERDVAAWPPARLGRDDGFTVGVAR
jgi:hypothetical protein